MDRGFDYETWLERGASERGLPLWRARSWLLAVWLELERKVASWLEGLELERKQDPEPAYPNRGKFGSNKLNDSPNNRMEKRIPKINLNKDPNGLGVPFN